MLKARFIPVILGLVLFGGAALAQTEVDTTAASVDHQIKVHLPTVVALSITKDGSTSDLSFTVTASQYYSNIGAPIAPDATGFNHLRPSRTTRPVAELSVGVVDSAGTAASAAVLDAVTLDGGNISAYSGLGRRRSAPDDPLTQRLRAHPHGKRDPRGLDLHRHLHPHRQLSIMTSRRLLLAGALTLALLAPMSAASAADIGLSPARLHLRSPPGGTASAEATVFSTQPPPCRCRSRTADWVQDGDGKLSFVPAGSTPYSASPWLVR